MNILKKIFCKHNYKKVATRKSHYCSDYLYMSDLGDYEYDLYNWIDIMALEEILSKLKEVKDE